jgi:hypothetical protein
VSDRQRICKTGLQKVPMSDIEGDIERNYALRGRNRKIGMGR